MRASEAEAMAVPVEPQNTGHLGNSLSIGDKAVEILRFHQDEYVDLGPLRCLDGSYRNVAALCGNVAFRTDHIRCFGIFPFCHRKRIEDMLRPWRVNAVVSEGYPPRRHVAGIFDIDADTPHGWPLGRIGNNRGIEKIDKSAVSQSGRLISLFQYLPLSIANVRKFDGRPSDHASGDGGNPHRNAMKNFSAAVGLGHVGVASQFDLCILE